MRNSQPEPPPAASTAVRERIEEYRAAHGGVFPKAIVVSREEFTELMGAFAGAPDDLDTLKFMGVDIHVGNLTYPWGTFPTREERAPQARFYDSRFYDSPLFDDLWPTP